MHAREQIRDAVVDQLTGLATTNSRVYAGIVRLADAASLPGIWVFTNEDELDEDSEIIGTKEFHNLTLLVEIRAKAVSGVDDVVDDVAEEVQAALYGDPTLGGLIPTAYADIELSSFELELSDDQEKDLALGTLTFIMRYRIDGTAPGTII